MTSLQIGHLTKNQRNSLKLHLAILCAIITLVSLIVPASDCWESVVPGMPLPGGRMLGGVYKKKAGPHVVLTPAQINAQIDAENKRVLLKQARTAIGIGIGILVAGFVLSAPIAAYLPRKAGDIIFYAGGGVTIWGFIIASMAKSFWFLAFLALFGLAAYALHKLKPKGLFGKKEVNTDAIA